MFYSIGLSCCGVWVGVDFFAGAVCLRGAVLTGRLAAARATAGLLMPGGARAIATSAGGGVTQPVTAAAATDNNIKENATRMRAIQHRLQEPLRSRIDGRYG
jgi:hypothetical protein